MKIAVSILAVCAMLVAGCGVDWFPAQSASSAASIKLDATPTSPVVGGQVTITATVFQSDGTTKVPDGTPVSFTITTSTPPGASLSTSSATTTGGVVSTTLNSPPAAGSVTVTASSGVANKTITVNFGSLVTVTANPNFISASLGGVSTLIATVKNPDGTNVADGTTVTFSVSPMVGTLTNNGSAQTSAGQAAVTLTVSANALNSTTTPSLAITATQGSNTGTTSVSIGN